MAGLNAIKKLLSEIGATRETKATNQSEPMNVAQISQIARLPETDDADEWVQFNKATEFDSHDDRRTCATCSRLTQQGRCLAADHGLIRPISPYFPEPDIKKRCSGYGARIGSSDPRGAAELWPKLHQQSRQKPRRSVQ